MELQKRIIQLTDEGRSHSYMVNALDISSMQLDKMIEEVRFNRARVREQEKNKIFAMSLDELNQITLTRQNTALVVCRLDKIFKGMKNIRMSLPIMRKIRYRYSREKVGRPGSVGTVTASDTDLTGIEAWNNIPKKKNVLRKQDFWDVQDLLDRGMSKNVICKIAGIGLSTLARYIRNGWLNEEQWQKKNKPNQQFGLYKRDVLIDKGSMNELANGNGFSWEEIKAMLETPQRNLWIKKI